MGPLIFYFLFFKCMFDWTWPTIQESSPAHGVKQTQSNTPQRNQKGFFFFISYLSHAWHFSKARGTRPQHPKGFFFFCCFQNHHDLIPTTGTPPLTRWPLSTVSQASRTYTDTHSYGTSIQAIKKKWQQIERRKGGGERDRVWRSAKQAVCCHWYDATAWVTRPDLNVESSCTNTHSSFL